MPDFSAASAKRFVTSTTAISDWTITTTARSFAFVSPSARGSICSCKRSSAMILVSPVSTSLLLRPSNHRAATDAQPSTTAIRAMNAITMLWMLPQPCSTMNVAHNITISEKIGSSHQCSSSGLSSWLRCVCTAPMTCRSMSIVAVLPPFDTISTSRFANMCWCCRA